MEALWSLALDAGEHSLLLTAFSVRQELDSCEAADQRQIAD
jgi:hypothetical protein